MTSRHEPVRDTQVFFHQHDRHYLGRAAQRVDDVAHDQRASPLVGSSISRIRLSALSSARASATICCCPPRACRALGAAHFEFGKEFVHEVVAQHRPLPVRLGAGSP